MKKFVAILATLGFVAVLTWGVLRNHGKIPGSEDGRENPNPIRSSIQGSGEAQAEDPAAHTKRLVENPNRAQGELPEALAAWAESDPDEALAWAEDILEGTERVRALDLGLRAWALRSPADAGVWVKDGEGDPLQERWAAIVSAAWAANSPQEAADWAMTLENEDVREGAAMAIARAWSADDPRKSAEWAINFYEDTDSPAPLQSAMEELAKHDVDEARRFLDQLPSNLDYVGVVQVGMEWAKADPQAAAQWAMGLDSPTNRAGAVTGVVGVWSEQSPSAAAGFVETLEGSAQSTAARFLLKSWVESDALAASTWLQTLPEGPVRDEGVSALSDGLMDSDPASAMQWSLSIGDEIMREFQVEDVLHSWLVRDKSSAEAWLVENDVPQEIIARAMDSAALN